jgi:phosphoribosylamine-glycine ligase
MKILLIDAMAAFLDFALRAEAQGHEVRLWLPKEKDGSHNTVGDGLVTKVSDWRGSMNWADLIVLSDNARFLGELEPWRRKGYPIFGPGREGASWELERGTGQQVLEAAGIACIPSHVFSGYKEAIEFVTGTGKRYVSKPTGDADKALSYVSKGPADMLFMLDYWDRTQKVKVPFLLQEFIPGIEMAVGGWVGRDGFLGMFLENFEFKKLMPGDAGVNCYSEDTEVLTKAGWKRFNAVTLDDECVSYDPATGTSFFEKPTRLHWTHYKGEMYSFRNRYADLLVTPSHNMFMARRKTTDWKIVPAQDCPCEFDILQTGLSTEADIGEFVLPDGTRIDGDAWMRFLGLYLSEGCTDLDRPRVTIYQNPGPKQEIMAEALKSMKLPWRVNGNRISLTHKGLAEYVRQFGLSAQKFVPPEVLGASARQIKLFLEAFNLGDGDNHYGRRRYCSGSERLIGDLQALMHLVGKAGVITTDTRTSMVSPLNGKTYTAQPVYAVEESTRKKVSIRGKEIVQYDGMIGCVMLPTTHLLTVRRNGRVCISGNTGEMGTVMKYCPIEESKLAQEMLLPLEAQLIRQGYTGYIDVAVIIDKKGKPWPLEFTTRPGWPLMQIQQILHPDVAGWMLDAVNGKDTFRPSGQIAAGFVVAHADFPFNKLPRAAVSGFPVWGITDSNRYFIHPSEMKLGMAPDFSSGSLKHVPSLVSAGQYLLTVSGRGWSVAEAVAGAFSRVKQLEVPNSPVYRIDIGERLEKQLPELQEFGYAVSWEWGA